MKYLHLTYIFVLFSMAAIAQEWKMYRIDPVIQVSLPEKFERKDTLGQTLISSDAPFGTIQITISPDNPKTTPDIEKERHLKRYYDDFRNRLLSTSAGGSILNERDTTVGKLKVKDLTLAVDSGSGKQYRNIRILHEEGNTYTFQYLFKDIHREYALPESRTFFHSIRFPADADVATQFTNPENTTGETPPGGKRKIIISAGVLLILIGIIYILWRRRRRH
ncbi:hypothetical protein [Pedobacter sp. SYSU D00535]|uniref:hypothetical protein n=1 Tax=Pedobacter sp. SYSU D00535 TaxID=2810308 RepID=UPI001A96FCFA|nr:hypothetical protein [Pedobacter sp. SYSU D00535]